MAASHPKYLKAGGLGRRYDTAPTWSHARPNEGRSTARSNLVVTDLEGKNPIELSCTNTREEIPADHDSKWSLENQDQLRQ